eukprot:767821-Hanusia_phi.AAC.13
MQFSAWQVLGRATWTVYHTFAVYLPDSMGDVEVEQRICEQSTSHVVAADQDLSGPDELSRLALPWQGRWDGRGWGSHGLPPWQGGAMMTAILNNDVMKKEIQSIKNREDGMLVAWKLHNAITAAVKPNAVPFPEALGESERIRRCCSCRVMPKSGIKPSMFDLLNQPNSNHVQLEVLTCAVGLRLTRLVTESQQRDEEADH